MDCEHELSCIDEMWFSEDELEVVMECNLCKARFHGTLKQNNLTKKEVK